jgi:hypothetical protein
MLDEKTRYAEIKSFNIEEKEIVKRAIIFFLEQTIIIELLNINLFYEKNNTKNSTIEEDIISHFYGSRNEDTGATIIKKEIKEDQKEINPIQSQKTKISFEKYSEKLNSLIKSFQDFTKYDVDLIDVESEKAEKLYYDTLKVSEFYADDFIYPKLKAAIDGVNLTAEDVIEEKIADAKFEASRDL